MAKHKRGIAAFFHARDKLRRDNLLHKMCTEGSVTWKVVGNSSDTAEKTGKSVEGRRAKLYVREAGRKAVLRMLVLYNG